MRWYLRPAKSTPYSLHLNNIPTDRPGAKPVDVSMYVEMLCNPPVDAVLHTSAHAASRRTAIVERVLIHTRVPCATRYPSQVMTTMMVHQGYEEPADGASTIADNATCDCERAREGVSSSAPNPSAHASATPNSMYGSSGSASSAALLRCMSEKGILISTATRTISGGGSGVSGGFSVEETDARSRSVERDRRSFCCDGGRDGTVSGGGATVGSSGSRRLLRNHRSHEERGSGRGVGAGVGGTGLTGLSGGFIHLHDTG